MTRKQILIVDDDQSIIKTIQFSLQATTNWEILKASSGKEGLLLAQATPPDLILLDVMMPVLDGIGVLHQLRNITATQKIPVIFMTAKALQKEQNSLKELDIQGIICKPFDAARLAEQICLLLDWESLEI
ncbi:response regulator [Leptolyngbya cf. ectocarpi LEGE 11479]|uniref:Response regulator n=1 Tax=Leptolyngbya cf. ectocarpi LEGE 11479 TaxID=1828722 RepID=A0A928ZWX9_LEPEC|nr:response regulator [Leptolyngbya ectocarpi]MBE9068910.1 response regulator [Leptolyngbya cf. ectocarpi LEGE 11479]